jgi:hypothetical protein
MIVFKSKFPFFRFVKKVEGKYISIDVNKKGYSSKEKELIKFCKNRLMNNGIPINKIHFVFDDMFTYDVDNNVVNPPYRKLVPLKLDMPIIEIGKPYNSMTIVLGVNRTYNNYGLLKEMLKNNKRGVVVLATSVDYDVEILMANLDNAYQYYVMENSDND